MKNYVLNIAGYNIGFEAAAEELDLIVSPKFLRYISSGTSLDIRIRIHSGSKDLPAGSERLFHAPLVEEINGILIQNDPEFWSIWEYNSVLFIKTTLPLSLYQKNAVLKFSMTDREWDLWIETDKSEIDPFGYPLDGLILYYLSVINKDIMIHASGVNYAGKGLLFSGVSGKGKTTMARLWENREASVIHDDRLIIRRSESGYQMYNTPVYNNDQPMSSSLDRIFIIEHGTENRMIPLKGASAVSQVMANCIQHSWDQAIISNLLESVSGMCRLITPCKLFFRPDMSIIEYIQKQDE
jgi:hypothetical protein